MAERPRVAVVTGGTKGIGRAICLALAPHLRHIFINSRSTADLAALAATLRLVNPELVVDHLKADFNIPEEVAGFGEFILNRATEVDLLINNAGIFYPGSVIAEQEGNLRSMMQVNLFSAYDLTRQILPAIRLSGRGHIFNICSIASLMAYPNGGAYTITKFALLGFNKCLRAELMNEQIKVTAVLPGATWSDSWAGADYPDERLMQATDIAAGILYASSLSPSANVEELLIRPVQGDL